MQTHGNVTATEVEAAEAKASGWAWRWTGWASWPISAAVLCVCAAAVVIDVGTSWWGRPEWYLGRVSMSPALPLGVLLVALIGPRNLGFSRRSFLAWRELSSVLRVLIDVGALVGVVLGLMLAGRRLGVRRRVPRVIDLRTNDASVAPVIS